MSAAPEHAPTLNVNVAVTDDLVLACTYGMQVGAFDPKTAELVDLDESLPDFAKGMAVVELDGRKLLIVGGRGGYVVVYALAQGSEFGSRLRRLRTLFVPPQPRRSEEQSIAR